LGTDEILKLSLAVNYVGVVEVKARIQSRTAHPMGVEGGPRRMVLRSKEESWLKATTLQARGVDARRESVERKCAYMCPLRDVLLVDGGCGGQGRWSSWRCEARYELRSGLKWPTWKVEGVVRSCAVTASSD